MVWGRFKTQNVCGTVTVTRSTSWRLLATECGLNKSWTSNDTHRESSNLISLYGRYLQHFKKQLLATSSLPVHPSFRIEELGAHWMDLHEIWDWFIFRKSARNFNFHYNV